MYQKLLSKENKLAVIGLGYVGLPIALELAKHISVIGFDISEERVAMMQRGEDPSHEVPAEEFDGRDIVFTTNPDDLQKVQFFVVAVPTPIDRYKVPDLTPLTKASQTVGRALKKGDYVVYESTVYPGCTEEDCLPILEQESGLQGITDFKLGYSPERINPGDTKHTLTKVVKVVAGCDEESLDTIAKVYELVVEAGVHRATSIKVAEAAKIIENTQRDLNIALMNELSLIFDRMNINTQDVLAAARTKWNFLPFYPGLVGGHCIGVDPYYLTYKSIQLGHKPEVILSGRRINDEMPLMVARKAVQMMIKAGKNIGHARALVMGATFKENVTDIRNTKVVDLVKELQSFSVNVDFVDPYACSKELHEEYGLHLTQQADISNNYDCVIVAVKHQQYCNLTEDYFKSISSENGILLDIKGMYNGKIEELSYWTM